METYMPVIFSTPTSHRVFMLDKDAAFMLKAMKTSGNVPGALYPDAIVSALDALKLRIEIEVENEDEEKSEVNTEQVEVNTKALPLIELLQRAIEQNEKLMWDKG